MTQFPAGKYYVGDLCYVLNSRWEEVCDKTIAGNDVLDGVFTLDDGTHFAMYGTRWGDGGYLDQTSKEYSVDSGTIGCVSVDAPGVDLTTGAERLGAIVEFPEPFDTDSDGSIIRIGHIFIDTDPRDEEDD